MCTTRRASVLAECTRCTPASGVISHEDATSQSALFLELLLKPLLLFPPLLLNLRPPKEAAWSGAVLRMLGGGGLRHIGGFGLALWFL
jgi:hypothetical protein